MSNAILWTLYGNRTCEHLDHWVSPSAQRSELGHQLLRDVSAVLACLSLSGGQSVIT